MTSCCMRWWFSCWSEGPCSWTAQEREGEFNPGVTVSLSWSWEHCSHTCVFSSEFLSESFEWSWVRLLGSHWQQAVSLAVLAPLYLEEELLVAGVAVVVLGVSMMLLLSEERRWCLIIPQRSCSEHCSHVAGPCQFCTRNFTPWKQVECEQQNRMKKCWCDQTSICRWVTSSETPLRRSLKVISSQGCKTWLKCDTDWEANLTLCSYLHEEHYRFYKGPLCCSICGDWSNYTLILGN